MSKFTDRIDMRFQYVSAAATDISKTIRREQKRLADEAAKREAEAKAAKVEAESIELEAQRKVRRLTK